MSQSENVVSFGQIYMYCVSHIVITEPVQMKALPSSLYKLLHVLPILVILCVLVLIVSFVTSLMLPYNNYKTAISSHLRKDARLLSCAGVVQAQLKKQTNKAT